MSWVHALERALGADGLLVVGAGVLATVLVVIHGLRRHGHGRAADLLSTGLLVVALGGIVLATLRPAGPAPEGIARRLILDPVLGASDGYGSTVWRPLLANVALFVPVGALAVARFPGRGVRVWLALVLLSVAVEAMQYALPIGRIANSADVLANAAGAALGVVLDRATAGLVGSRRRPGAAPAVAGARRRR